MLKSGLIRGPMASFIFFARSTAARFIAPDFCPCSSNRNGSWRCSKQLANFDILPGLKAGDSYCAHPGIEPE